MTLGFGEIFRITVLNLDGTSGPDVTNGSNGISSIPNLDILGFDFGVEHSIAGFTIARFANYFLLMLLITLVVVVVFRRSSDSRIGRAWIAIREDETAALAMGINGFRVKLIAFALGAALAGLAGTVQAHVTYTVTPEQYQFAHVVPPQLGVPAGRGGPRRYGHHQRPARRRRAALPHPRQAPVPRRLPALRLRSRTGPADALPPGGPHPQPAPPARVPRRDGSTHSPQQGRGLTHDNRHHHHR
ncbi:hypothetical protein GCM10020295_63020 [Streptomyces cinereospinus]